MSLSFVHDVFKRGGGLWLLFFLGILTGKASAAQLATPAVSADWSFAPYDAVSVVWSWIPPSSPYHPTFGVFRSVHNAYSFVHVTDTSGYGFYDNPPHGYEYDYKVYAYPDPTDSANTQSNPGTDSSLTPPLDPTSLSISNVYFEDGNPPIRDHFHVTWNDDGIHDGGYYLFRSDDEGESYNLIATLPHSTFAYDDPNINLDHPYYYGIFRYNALCWSYNYLLQAGYLPPATYTVTTYFSPIEASYTGSRITVYGQSVKSDWWLAVNGTNGNGEGWGKLDGTHGSHSGKYMSYNGHYADDALGSANNILVAGQSLATYPPQLPFSTYPIDFTMISNQTHMPVKSNGYGEHITGRADDGGSGIGENHIDLYVGTLNKPGSSINAYHPDTFDNTSVTY